MNPKVKAIITVDMNGLPVDYDQIGIMLNPKVSILFPIAQKA